MGRDGMSEDDAYARRTDPSTAHGAAESVKPKVSKLEMAVLECLRRRGDKGGTSEEVAVLLDISRVTVSPRFRPLATKGWIIDSGERRKGASHRPSIVWKAKKTEPPPPPEQKRLL